jgi:hypothetical protein
MVVGPVHLHPFYALIDSGQQKSRQCGTRYGACEWDTSDQRSRMMTRSVRVLCSWLTVGTSWIYSKCKYYFLRRNCDLPLLQLTDAYILYTVPKQPRSSQWSFHWIAIPCLEKQRQLIRMLLEQARVNQQPPMHQFSVLSTGWAAFFIGRQMGASQSNCFCCWPLYFYLFIAFLGRFFSGPDLTDSYPPHFLTLINIVPTLVPY